MKFCILSWAILVFGRTQLAAANEEIRIRHTHDADPRFKGMDRLTKGKRNPLTPGLLTPKNAIHEMEEDEHRSLRSRKRGGKRHDHSIFNVFDRNGGQQQQSGSSRSRMYPP